jgi:Domain of unknown function (DUF4157)/Phage tail lysozyme
MFQGTNGNQAMPRHPTRRLSRLPATAEWYEQAAAAEDMTAREAPRGLPWDFNKIPIFPPNRATGLEARSSLGAPRLAGVIQAKLVVGEVNDPLEHEADRVADAVMRGSEAPPAITAGGSLLSRKCAACAEEESTVQTKPVATARRGVGEAPPVVHDALRASGRPLDAASRTFFEPRFSFDFSRIRIHAEASSARATRALQARAFTVGENLFFDPQEYRPATQEGRWLIAHELTHALQQRGGAPGPLRRQPQQQPAPTTSAPQTQAPADPLTAPLTEAEWRGVWILMSRGVIGVDPLTADSDQNADLLAGAVFCNRWVGSPDWGKGDPLLCLIAGVTAHDPRVQQIKQQMLPRGPFINWAAVALTDRFAYVIRRLVDVHHFPANGAAGIVGNLRSESFVMPSTVEGASEASPMRARNLSGRTQDLNPEDVQNRGQGTPAVGPEKPGAGLAQWTSEPRRSDLFQQPGASGQPLGASVLFNMDAQIDYLVSEIRARAGINATLTNAAISVNDACDEYCYNMEIPGSVLGPGGRKLPRTDPAVQAEFNRRRPSANAALRAYQAAHNAQGGQPGQGAQPNP